MTGVQTCALPISWYLSNSQNQKKQPLGRNCLAQLHWGGVGGCSPLGLQASGSGGLKRSAGRLHALAKKQAGLGAGVVNASRRGTNDLLLAVAEEAEATTKHGEAEDDGGARRGSCAGKGAQEPAGSEARWRWSSVLRAVDRAARCVRPRPVARSRGTSGAPARNLGDDGERGAAGASSSSRSRRKGRPAGSWTATRWRDPTAWRGSGSSCCCSTKRGREGQGGIERKGRIKEARKGRRGSSAECAGDVYGRTEAVAGASREELLEILPWRASTAPNNNGKEKASGGA